MNINGREKRYDVFEGDDGISPSKELVECYRIKLDRMNKDYDDIYSKVEEYKMQYRDQEASRKSVIHKDEMIAELQKAVSELQLYVHREKDHVLRLSSENDRLKLHQLEDKKKIQHLLKLLNVPENELTLFLHELPVNSVIPQLHTEKVLSSSSAEDAVRQIQNEILVEQVKVLQSQLERHARLAKEEIESLITDRRIRVEETEARRKHDAKTIQDLLNRLQETESKLHMHVSEHVSRKRQSTSHDTSGEIKLKAPLNQKLQEKKDDGAHLKENKRTFDKKPICQLHCGYATKIKNLQSQLARSQKIAEHYKSLYTRKDLVSSKKRQRVDSTETGEESVKVKVLDERLQLARKQYDNLVRRRKFEMEGFKTDISTLKNRLHEVEKLLLKVTMKDYQTAKDQAVVNVIQRTAVRSKKIAADLQSLKAKVYSIESDLQLL